MKQARKTRGNLSLIPHLLAAALLLPLSAQAQGVPCATSTISKEPGAVRVRLLDAATARALPGLAVTLESSNGIACLSWNCPTNARAVALSADDQGFILIPAGFLQSETSLNSKSHYGNVIEDSICTREAGWVIELLPNDSNVPTPPGDPRPLKLIDARTRHAIADQPVHIEFRRANGESGTLESACNALGYVFIPLDIVLSAAENTWLTVPGYRRTRADFAWAMRKTELQPR